MYTPRSTALCRAGRFAQLRGLTVSRRQQDQAPRRHFGPGFFQCRSSSLGGGGERQAADLRAATCQLIGQGLCVGVITQQDHFGRQ